MRLTDFLFRRNRMPHGHIFRGKDRFVRRVEPKHIRDLQERYAVEENNMLLLKYPYLTEEQSCGHAKALGKHEQFIKKVKAISQSYFSKKDVTIAERLKHFDVKNAWD